MRRRASDNEYLHRDFHGALSTGLEYLHRRYGAAAVREYLRQFTAAFYAPLSREIGRRGLAAIRDHYRKVYETEGGRLSASLTDHELTMTVPYSPAVRHLRRRGYPVARLFVETIRTVNETLCEGTPFEFELVKYDPKTGSSVQRFYRRKQ